jgi:hypothetical protein
MAKDKFKDYVDPQQYKEGSPEYTAAIIYNKAYEESINSLVFLQSTFDDHIDRLGNMYKQLDKLKSISSNPFSNFDVITDAVKLNEQINYLKLNSIHHQTHSTGGSNHFILFLLKCWHVNDCLLVLQSQPVNQF